MVAVRLGGGCRRRSERGPPPDRQIRNLEVEFIDGDLMLRIPPSPDGTPVMIGVRSLAEALAGIERRLA